MATWSDLKDIFTQSSNKIEIFEPECDGTELIGKMGIDENTVIGLCIANAAMLRINGYLRIWGTGNGKNHRNIMEYGNELRKLFGGNRVFIADDVWGGIFAISNGDFEGAPQHVWYFAPDTLQWESLEVTYSQFLSWVSDTGINEFYSSFLWSRISGLLDEIKFNQGLSIYPPLWAKECDSETASIKIIPFDEIIAFNAEVEAKN